jgi:hypothetical protein
MRAQLISIPLIGLLTLQGCGVIIPATRSESKLSSISIGQPREEVVQHLGTPATVRGAQRLPDGRAIQVDEYTLWSKDVWWVNIISGPFLLTLPWWWMTGLNKSNDYWVQYVDGKLDRWGRAGDWQPQITGDFTIRQK